MKSEGKVIKNTFAFDGLVEGGMLSISLFGCIFVSFLPLNPDLFFIINNGRHIYETGNLFPVTLFSTIHEGFSTVIQQPLYCLLVYILYGKVGLLAVPLLSISFSIICLITLMYLFRDAKNTAVRCALSSCILILSSYAFSGRPFAVTITLMLLSILILEKVLSGYFKASFLLVPNLILQLLCHAAFFPVHLFLCLSYLAAMVMKKSHDNAPYVLTSALALSLILSFLTPYGARMPLYLFYSYGSAAGAYIKELARPDILSVSGIAVFASFLLLLKTRKRVSSFRTFLFLMGILSAAMHLRNIYLLCIFALPYLIEMTATGDRESDGGINGSVIMLPLCTVLTFLFILGSRYERTAIKDCSDTPVGACEYLKGNEDKRIFTTFNNGAFMEFMEFKAYIDARPELYDIRINKKADILSEYMGVYDGYGFDYDGFLKYYDFDYLVVDKRSHLNEYLTYRGAFPCYQGNGYLLYEGGFNE